MAGITLAQAEAKHAEVLTALSNAYTCQEYETAGGLRQVRPDIAKLESALKFWEREIQRLSRGGIRITGATPC